MGYQKLIPFLKIMMLPLGLLFVVICDFVLILHMLAKWHDS
jgi:hypothetical protein